MPSVDLSLGAAVIPLLLAAAAGLVLLVLALRKPSARPPSTPAGDPLTGAKGVFVGALFRETKRREDRAVVKKLDTAVTTAAEATLPPDPDAPPDPTPPAPVA